jgi:cleavage and polyadenylation specificity factor subunit 4
MICGYDDYNITFDFENILESEDARNFRQDASREVCKFYLKDQCTKGKDCPYRHIRAEKAVVCKHWLRGLCKKGDSCEFLHEYNPKKMPECWFFAKYGECSNPECIFLHINKEDKIRACPWFDRGFCKHGPNCRLRHVLRTACPDYMAGFCYKGPNCKFSHPKFDIPKDMQDHLTQNAEFGVRRKVVQRKTNSSQQQRSIPTLHSDTTESNRSVNMMGMYHHHQQQIGLMSTGQQRR